MGSILSLSFMDVIIAPQIESTNHWPRYTFFLILSFILISICIYLYKCLRSKQKTHRSPWTPPPTMMALCFIAFIVAHANARPPKIGPLSPLKKSIPTRIAKGGAPILATTIASTLTYLGLESVLTLFEEDSIPGIACAMIILIVALTLIILLTLLKVILIFYQKCRPPHPSSVATQSIELTESVHAPPAAQRLN